MYVVPGMMLYNEGSIAARCLRVGFGALLTCGVLWILACEMKVLALDCRHIGPQVGQLGVECLV